MNLPADTIIKTLLHSLLADPGLVCTLAAVQRRFHQQAALIGSVALAHDQHLRHIVRHAPVEVPRHFLAEVSVARVCRARLEHGQQVLVANGVTETNRHLVKAGPGTVIHCEKEKLRE